MNSLVKIPAILLICSIFCMTSCRDKLTLPVVVTNNVTDITPTTALTGGKVTGDGGAEVTLRGVCWSTSGNPSTTNDKTSDGSGTGSFISNLVLLTPNTTYYVRSYATNSEGTSYGNQVTFVTGKVFVPILWTYDPNHNTITSTMAFSGGYIDYDGGSDITTRGVCWGTINFPTIADSHTNDGTGTGGFNSNLTGLLANTTYYVRAYATNSEGTGYGDQISFVTMAEIGPIIFNPNLTYTMISDIDGNIYKTIQIGTQIWMSENLRTTKYNDGTQIPFVNDKPWTELITPAYTWYYNDAATYKAAYGALYNWYALNAANNGNKNVCPTGWHVPSESDWTELTTYLGGDGVAGSKLKETGSSHWRDDDGQTNESGFTALPGGYYESGLIGGGSSFSAINEYGCWWSSTEKSGYAALTVSISSSFKGVFRWETAKEYGNSVRCIMDKSAP